MKQNFLQKLICVFFCSNDICNPTLNITMCPQCDSSCDFWKLEETCIQAKVTYLFDNSFTIIFAVFMSFWSK